VQYIFWALRDKDGVGCQKVDKEVGRQQQNVQYLRGCWKQRQNVPEKMKAITGQLEAETMWRAKGAPRGLQKKAALHEMSTRLFEMEMK
jgi:hypothetical protein